MRFRINDKVKIIRGHFVDGQSFSDFNAKIGIIIKIDNNHEIVPYDYKIEFDEFVNGFNTAYYNDNELMSVHNNQLLFSFMD